MVTAAVFAPKPQLYLTMFSDLQKNKSIHNISAISKTNNLNSQTFEAFATSSKPKIRNKWVFIAINVINFYYRFKFREFPSLDRALIFGSSQNTQNSLMSSTINVGSSNLKDYELMGDVIVSADLNGSLKIFLNPSRIRTGASNFFDNSI